jgi:membrane protein implicated in regulation of membrane protease activity
LPWIGGRRDASCKLLPVSVELDWKSVGVGLSCSVSEVPMLNQRRGLALVMALTFVAAGCGAKSINQVLADPAKYRNQTVTVHGTVDESASVLGRGAYRITDDGQNLWVVTSGGAPRKGARVNVTGHLQEGYDLSGLGNIIKLPGAVQSGLVLVEESHKAKD